MSDFDPDAYLAGGAASGFDPDEYLGKKKETPSQTKSAVGGAFQGVTLGFGDELSGLLGRLAIGDGVKLGKGARPAHGDSPELIALKEKALAQEEAQPTSYEISRDLVRGGLKEAREANPGTFLAGEILGGSLLPIPGGAAAQGASKGAKLLRAIAQGAGTGAVYGLGNSEAQLNRGDVAGAAADTGMGTAIGAGSGAVAEGVIAPLASAGGRLLKRGGEKLVDLADEGIAKAREMALTRATKEGTEELGSLTGKLGAETQKGSRLTENIRRIPGDAVEATPESQAALMREAARIARERADDMLNQAKAQGLEDVPNKVGEFLSRGSKVDQAQKARGQAVRMLEGAKKLELDAERVLKGELAPDALNANLSHARDIAMGSAPFAKLEGTVLSENLRVLPEQVAKIEAARAARDVAEKGLGANAQKRAAELLSGAAAKQALMERVKRYGLPLAGSAIGYLSGDDTTGKAAGAAIGLAAGRGVNGAIGALAGAGLRPGFQSLYRMATEYPAVQNALWRLVRKTGEREPEKLMEALPKMLPAASRAGLQGDLLMRLLERAKLSDSRRQVEDPLAAQ